MSNVQNMGTILNRLDKVQRKRKARIIREDIPPFNQWLAETTPELNWNWNYIQYTIHQLERLSEGEISALGVFMPPRHGKSTLVTIHFAAWHINRFPDKHVIVAAYNQDLANKFSRAIRRLVRESELPLSDERTAVNEWETAVGGSLKAVGVGSGITGRGGDLIIIDDPVKSKEESLSETYRQRSWDWYRTDLLTRLEPNGKQILIQTRWHTEDLAGKIIDSSSDNWQMITFPALAEEGDILGRLENEALCPERFSVEDLEGIRNILGKDFEALYQQRPLTESGLFFEPDWFTEILPSAIPELSRKVRFWDFAASQAKGDYTVGALVGKDNQNNYYILDVNRFRETAAEIERRVAETAKIDGYNVTICLEEEPGSSGKNYVSHLIRNVLSGFPVNSEKPTGNKETRARALSAQAEHGKVFIVKAHWNREFLVEAMQFPVGKHDDQIDAVSGAFNQLSTTNTTLVLW